MGTKIVRDMKTCLNFGSLFLVFVYFVGCEVKSDKIIDRKIYSVDVVDSFSVDAPLKRFKFHYPNFYSYNFYTKQLHKHDLNFKVIDSLGGEGDAPFENKVVLNYSILSEDRVGIFDSDKKSYKIQDWNDSVHFYFKADKNFGKGIVLNDSSIFLSFFYDEMKLGFAINTIRDGRFFELQDVNQEFNEPTSYFTYEGKLVRDGDEVYSFSYLYTDFFKIDTRDSSVTRLKYGYDHDFGKPKVHKIPDGYMADDNPTIIADAIVTEDRIYVLSNYSIRRFRSNRLLDVYDKKGFRYLKSYLVPNRREYPPGEVFTDGKYMYFKYEDIILKVELGLEKVYK